MRTKHFYLCLLLLVLGTANVWADKYYEAWDYKTTVPRYSNLAEMIGQKFMIYNTSLHTKGDDRTGFLYNNGVALGLDKTKERDRFVYNEKFIFTIVEHDADGDGVNDSYAIKSITSGTYLDINGNTTHPTPQPLYIKDWTAAKDAKWSLSGDVKSEKANFEGVNNGSITTDACMVFVIKNDGNVYWNGEADHFSTYSQGHPYAFYKVNEVVSGDYLQDLHIFSRCDIYSAQVIWGYMQDPAKITFAPADNSQNTLLLIDGDADTGVTTGAGTGEHYIQFNLGKAVDGVYIHLQRIDENVPENVKVQVSPDGTSSWTDIATYSTGLATNLSFTQQVTFGGPFQYVRVVNTEADAQMAFSEVYVLPNNSEVEQSVGYFNVLKEPTCPVYNRATPDQYRKAIDDYNKYYSSVKTLSGVPLPGNKYRIYADAYDDTKKAYVNREIYYDSTTDSVKIAEQGTYSATAANARKGYEWYCEQTPDGKLMFRNVSNRSIYLANNGEVSNGTIYAWSMSTVQTQRFGVPLWHEGKYLAVANDGSQWVPGVTTVQNQETSAGYAYQTAGAETPEDDTDDVWKTITSGVCTDFVFIPVEVLSTEKKVTFTANEITKRNSVFSCNGVEYSLPYSRMFVEGDEDPTLTLECPEIHRYKGVYVNNSTTADEEGRAPYADGVITFDLDVIEQNETLEIKLEFNPFEGGMGSSQLYLIRSLRNQSLQQQAPGMRKADSDIEIGDGPIPTAGSNVYYARFNTVDTLMTLDARSKTVDYNLFDARSFFYFDQTEDVATTEYYSVNIRSAITPMKCATPTLWNSSGDTWYIQPNTVGNMAGYAIGLNVLDATNEPADAWCTSHNDGDKIISYNVQDAGALWEFVPVEADDAAPIIRTFISKTVTDTKAAIDRMQNIDTEKAEKYKDYADAIETAATNTVDDIATLVQLAQTVHMLEHEIAFALQPLPEVTSRQMIGEDGDYDHPHWYYIYNVKSFVDTGTKHYAKYTGSKLNMALDNCGGGVPGLEHMFYFDGRKVTEELDANNLIDTDGNALTFDDYLQVDIHNFLVPDTTLVSENIPIWSGNDLYPGHGENNIVTGLNLKNDEVWRIECEYEFTGETFESYNIYGTTLLSSTNPGISKYTNEFQIYLQEDREIVVKLNQEFDDNKTRIAVDHYKKIRIVITHSPKNTMFDIYNALGEKVTYEYPDAVLNTVTRLTSMLPAKGVKISILGIEYVKAFTWERQDTSAGTESATTDTKNEKDTWYVLPSSNTNYPGYSIVVDDPNDRNFGWTNVSGQHSEIFSSDGSVDNSSWQFEQIKEFDSLVDELLEKYDASDCVIYNEELAALFRLISKNASYIKKATYDNPIEVNGRPKTDEDFFNEIYEAIKNYDGPMPDVLNKPKPGKFYTIRPAYGNSDVRLAVNDWNSLVQREGLIEVVDDKKHYDSHSVWFFEGTADGEYLKRDENLTLNSLHTQSNTKDFTAEKYMLDDDATAENIVLSPVGGCIVRLNDGSVNLRHKAIGDTALVGNNGTMSYGYVNTTFNRTGTDDASVTSTAFNEFSELVLSDDEANTPFTVSVASNYDYKGTSNAVTTGILCPNVNGGSEQNTSNTTTTPIELIFTYNNLPSTFTSFNNLGLHIHALNGGGSYQYNDDKKARQWNIAVSVSTDGGNTYSDFGSVSDIDIAAGIEGSNKVWNIVKSDEAPAFTIDGSLILKLTIQKGTTNMGCFFGLSNVILSAEGDTWYIEEMPDADKVNIFHETKTNSNIGLGSLMLGYTAKIPTGISAYYPATNQDLTDRHITFRSYGEPSDPVRLLPACTPAILKIADGADKSATYRFYYDANEVDDAADKATEDEKIIIEGSLYKKYVHVANTYGNRFGDGYSSNVYMYLSSSTTPKLTWVWYNYTAEGVNTGNNNTGGHVNVNANRAYIVMGKAVAKNIGSFSMRFDGGWTTDIEDIEDDYSQEEANDGAEGIFDLQGRRLNEITEPGIYIVNGEKVLVK